MNKLKRMPSVSDRRAVRAVIGKVIGVGRAGLELYLAVKKKDLFYLGHSLTTTYDAVESLLTKEYPSPHARLRDMGLVRMTGMERIVFDVVREMGIVGRVEFKQNDDSSNEVVTSYAIGDQVAYFLLEGGTVQDLYVSNEDDFFMAFAKAVVGLFGSNIRLNTARESWKTVCKLDMFNVDVGTYVCTVDEKEFHSSVMKFKRMGLNRSSLLCGPPGCGKTTFAAKIADMMKGRLMVVDSMALNQIAIEGWMGVLQKVFRLLSPSVVLFDDIDRLEPEHLGMMLGAIEDLNKYKGSQILIMATVNDLESLPEAMRRPGRFDEIIVFDRPNEDQRRQIIRTYMGHFTVWLAGFYVEEMVRLTEGLTPAFLREIVLQTSILSYERIPGIIARMKQLQSIDDDEEDDEDKDEDDRKNNYLIVETNE